VSGEKDLEIGIEEERENDELTPEDSECEYYENEEGNYVNIWS